MSNSNTKERLDILRGKNVSRDEREMVGPRAAVAFWKRVFGQVDEASCVILVGDGEDISKIEIDMRDIEVKPELLSWRIKWKNPDGTCQMNGFNGWTRVHIQENDGIRSVVVFDSRKDGSPVFWKFTPKK